MMSSNSDVELDASNVSKEAEAMESGLDRSSRDPEKLKDGEEAIGDKGMNLALVTLLLLMLALQFSFLLSRYIVDSDNGLPASISLIVTMALGIIAVATLFQQIFAGRVHLRDNSGLNLQVNAILRDNLSLVGIIFFCPFACLLDIFKIFTEISCGGSWRTRDDYEFFLTDVIFCVLHVIFMTMELLFCVQFRRLVMKKNVSKIRKLCVKLSLTIVVAANIGLWFNVILRETVSAWSGEGEGEFEFEEVDGNDSTLSYESCLEGAFSGAEETVKESLYPFSVEFSLLVLEFMASHLIFNKHHDEQETEVEPYAAPPSPDSLPQSPPPRLVSLKSIPDARRNFAFSVTSPLVIIFGVFSNLLSIAFTFFSTQEVFIDEVLKVTLIHNQYFNIFYWILLIILMTIGFVSACRFKPGRNTLKGIDYVVMVSAFGPFICFVIRIIVVFENLEGVSEVYDPAILWLPEVLNLIQVAVQLPFMFFADCIQRPSEEEGQKPRWRIFKATVLSMAICNITLWLLDSLVRHLDIVASIFVRSQWTIIDSIFLPFAIFFRFNSSLILLRAFLR